MKLRYIDLRTTYKSIYSKYFDPESHVISGLYWSFLRNYSTPFVQQVNIFISDDWDNSLTSLRDVKGFKEAFIDFNFKKYFSLDKYAKKKMQLEAVHRGMMEIAEKESWSIGPLIEAYNGCLETNLEYKFSLGRVKSARNRKYKIELWCNWEMDFIDVYWVLYDNKDSEIKREQLTRRLSHEGSFVYFLKWKWLDNTHVLIEDTYKYGKDEKWDIDLSFLS